MAVEKYGKLMIEKFEEKRLIKLRRRSQEKEIDTNAILEELQKEVDKSPVKSNYYVEKNEYECQKKRM